MRKQMNNIFQETPIQMSRKNIFHEHMWFFSLEPKQLGTENQHDPQGDALAENSCARSAGRDFALRER